MMSLPEGLVRSQLQAVADAEVQILGVDKIDDLDFGFLDTQQMVKRKSTKCLSILFFCLALTFLLFKGPIFGCQS